MGLFNLGKKIDKGLDILDQAVPDKDKLNDLKYTLEQARAELLLSGKGSSITKITICGLAIVIIGVVSYTFLFQPQNMQNAKDYAYVAGTIMGLLTGGYLTGTSFKHSKWAKE